jgi:hypothetical protein
MRIRNWLIALTALIACGLIAAGCGSDDDETTSATGGETSTTQDGDSGASSASTPDDVYQACLGAIEGTAAESAGKTACEQAKNAFAKCSEQADKAPEGTVRDKAIAACQNAADAATAALTSGGSGASGGY